MKPTLPKTEDLKGRLFIGKVVAINDPDEMERVKIRIPYIYDDIRNDEDLPWAMPIKHRAMGATPNNNSFGVPAIDTDVAVMFDAGERYSPLYMGSITTIEDLKKIAGTTYGATYGIQDTSGNYLYVDTATNIAKFHHVSGTEITVNANGSVVLTTVNNVTQTINGNVTQTVTGNVTETVTGNVSITSSANVSITASSNATITVGGSSITVTPSSITITSSGPVTVTGSVINLN